MNNKTFIQELSVRSGFTQEDIQKMVYTMVDVMNEHFQKALPVSVAAFGVFEVKKRMERIMVSPATGRRMLVPPKIVLTFRATKLKKTDIPHIARRTAEKHHLEENDVVQLLTQLYELIDEALQQDRIVKVKGLGTFKLVDVKERESVDVNTGKRIVISSHTKTTFTPDSVLKDLVNKPFAQFETVEIVNEELLKDNGLQPDADSNETTEEAPSPAAEAEQSTDNAVSPETSPVVGAYPCRGVPLWSPAQCKASLARPHTAEESQVTESDENTLSDDDDESDDNSRHSLLWLWMTLIVAVVAAGMFVLGYYMGSKGIILFDDSKPSSVVDTTDVSATIDGRPQGCAPTRDTIDTDSISSTADSTATTVTKTEQPASTGGRQQGYAPTTIDQEQLERARLMVSKGAYTIIGTTETITVAPGKTIKQISKYYFGDGMECYLQVHNNIVEVSEGMTLKIPKLQSKKKRK